MENISIVIPLRIESHERETNLHCVLKSLLQFDYVYIDLLEADTEQHFSFPKHERLRYRFIYDNESVFYRTKYLNILIKDALFFIVGIWDADILLPENQLKQAIYHIQKGYVMCLPYDGECRFLNETESNIIREKTFFPHPMQGVRELGRPSVGGAFLVNRDLYLAAGGENEDFYGWGPEDVERVKRMEILELPIIRVKGSFYHLFHKRIPDKGIDNMKKRLYNIKVLLQTCRMNKQELRDYIDKYMLK